MFGQQVFLQVVDWSGGKALTPEAKKPLFLSVSLVLYLA